jgi:hypothetical protein
MKSPAQWWENDLTQAERDVFMDDAGKPLSPYLQDVAIRTGVQPVSDGYFPDTQTGPTGFYLPTVFIKYIIERAAVRP